MSRRIACSNHCSGCDSCFRSLEAFDAHRAGDFAGERVCLEVDSCHELAVASEDGICRAYYPDREGRVIYTSARSLGRAGEAFGARGNRPPARVTELGAKPQRAEKPPVHSQARVAA